jgi:hypothetical protein
VLARPRYGDALVDAGAGWGAGVDACTVDTVRLEGDQLTVAIRSAFASSEPLRLVVRSERPLHVTVNGHPLGYFPAEALAAGIAAPRS